MYTIVKGSLLDAGLVTVLVPKSTSIRRGLVLYNQNLNILVHKCSPDRSIYQLRVGFFAYKASRIDIFGATFICLL